MFFFDFRNFGRYSVANVNFPLFMKNLFALTAAAILSIASAHSAIIFNPANPLNVSNQGGFTGFFNPPDDEPFTRALVRFNFTGLNPASFAISGISLSGPGISSPLSFANINITGSGTEITAFADLDSNVDPLDFATSTVSFSVPGGVINDGASFSVSIRYSSADGGQVGTSTSLTYTAQSAAPIPEPGTWAAAALLAGGAAFMRWRRRKVA